MRIFNQSAFVWGNQTRPIYRLFLEVEVRPFGYGKQQTIVSLRTTANSVRAAQYTSWVVQSDQRACAWTLGALVDGAELTARPSLCARHCVTRCSVQDGLRHSRQLRR